ncbi:uncharacterized protein LOC142170191 [Nicotiana tabacum]|uniref:Uncharacterized protein LOC142170191 n=1 Tax=Nicotiana tabacum TaxID=4097 RepID=A0AC58ST40_TOBAC
MYLLSRLPSKVVGYKSPFEMLYLQSPSLSHLRVFRCLCYATTSKVLDKFSPKSVPVVLMGYSSTQKSYLQHELPSKTFLVTHENPTMPVTPSSSSLYSEADNLLDLHLPQTSDAAEINSEEELIPTLNNHVSIVEVPYPDAINSEPFARCRRSSRPGKPPIWLQDYVTKIQRSKCSFIISAHVDYSHISPAYRQALSAYSAASEPTISRRLHFILDGWRPCNLNYMFWKKTRHGLL